MRQLVRQPGQPQGGARPRLALDDAAARPTARSTPTAAGNRRLDACAVAEGGTRVHLQGDGFVVVFRIVSTDGDTEYWATSDLTMGEGQRQKYAELAWGIAVDHRGLKQFCGVERAQVRAARAQRNHITCALRAFLRFEQHRTVTGVSWWAAKTGIIRDGRPPLPRPPALYPHLDRRTTA